MTEFAFVVELIYTRIHTHRSLMDSQVSKIRSNAWSLSGRSEREPDI